MIPFANLIAGVLIGLANEPWVPVLVAPLGWGVIWVVYQFGFGLHRARVAQLAGPNRRLVLKSPTLTFIVVEWAYAVFVSEIAAIIVYFVKVTFVSN